MIDVVNFILNACVSLRYEHQYPIVCWEIERRIHEKEEEFENTRYVREIAFSHSNQVKLILFFYNFTQP
jgi:hypothetical protein